MPLSTNPLKYFFITINFHKNDIKIFEDWISQLLSLIEDDTLIWCIENDNTPDRHFHAVVSNNIKNKHYKDRDKFKQLILPKLKTYLKKVFNSTLKAVDNTARQGTINISDILADGYLNKKGEDKVGYCAKQFTGRNGGSMSQEDIQKHKLVYLNQISITEDKIKNYIEVKPLTIKTAFIYMYDFFKSYSPPINSIFSSMTYEGFDFTQISGNQKDQLRNQLKLRAHKLELIKLTKIELKQAEQSIDNIPHMDIYNEYDKLKDKIQDLIYICNANEEKIHPDVLEKIIIDAL